MSDDLSGRVENPFGMSIGYNDFPIQKVGYGLGFSWLRSNDFENFKNIYRFEGNVGYALNSIFLFKVGLNFIRSSEFAPKNLESMVGAQAGVGVQLDKNFGLELNYLDMNYGGNKKIAVNGVVSDLSYDLKTRISGFELGIYALF